MASVMEFVTDDGGVLKQVLKAGKGPLMAESSFVIFHYNAYVGEDDPEPFDSTWLRNQPCRIRLDNLLVRGLAIALMGMQKGEECRILLSPEYAFGAAGCPPRIPPAATLLYEITLLNFVELEGDSHELQDFHQRDFKKLAFEEVMKMCARANRNGNRLFGIDDYRGASSYYADAIRALKSAPPSQELADEQALWRELLAKLYNNAALCALRMRSWQQAVNNSRRALELDKSCAKALYRCGVGLRMLGRLKEAADMMRRAARFAPNSTALVRDMVELDKELAREQGEEAELCRRMLRGLGTCDVLPVEARREAIFEAVEPMHRRLIERALDELKSQPGSSSKAFTDGFSKAEHDYVRLLCQDMGLACEDFEDGVMASVKAAPEPADAVDPMYRRVITLALDTLSKAPVNTSLPFTDDFTKAELDYVRALCMEKGLACEEVAGGLVATVATAAGALASTHPRGI